MTIRIITEPSIYLVGKQIVATEEQDRFLNEHGFSGWSTDAGSCGEELVEMAGRACYSSFKVPRPGGNAAYIGHILDVGHGSVLEHAVYSFIFTGISRSLTHELVRHRVGFSYSQLSQRFVDEGDVAFVAPPALMDEVMAARRYEALEYSEEQLLVDSPLVRLGCHWLEACRSGLEEYRILVEYLEGRSLLRKQAREAARSVLPNCTETSIFVTANARALRTFIELRADPAADAEIRRLAVALLRVLQAEAPNLFGDFTIDGDTASTTHHKV